MVTLKSIIVDLNEEKIDKVVEAGWGGRRRRRRRRNRDRSETIDDSNNTDSEDVGGYPGSSTCGFFSCDDWVGGEIVTE